MKYEIFKAGHHEASDGSKFNFTTHDIAAMAEAYNTNLHEAPIVIGHPNDTAPAYGWIKELVADGDKLLAEFGEVDEDFAQLVRDKRYKKVSASFYSPSNSNNPKPGTWYLRHLGFLGAQPPAIKGLKQINFSEGEECIEFSKQAFNYTAGMFRRLREWLLSNFGKDAADEAIPDSLINDISLSSNKSLQTSFFSEPFLSPTLSKELNMNINELKKARAEAEEAKAELKKLQDEQEKSLREAAHKINSDFAEKLTQAGKLKPADKDLVVQMLDFMEYPENGTVDFGEAGNKKTLSQAFRDFLNNQQEILEFSEIATKPTADQTVIAGTTLDYAEFNPEGLNHHVRALAYAQKNNVSYEEAARLTIK